MKNILYFMVSLLFGLFPTIANAKCLTNTILEEKLNDIVFVVYCEDRTDITAMSLVMSTIYNRANSYDVNLLHKEIVKKNQYYCYGMKSTVKKINQKEYKNVYNLVCDFITNERSPITKAKYFYNHNLVRPKFINRLTIVQIYGSHTYLI